jgi:hypothetical protein
LPSAAAYPDVICLFSALESLRSPLWGGEAW